MFKTKKNRVGISKGVVLILALAVLFSGFLFLASETQAQTGYTPLVSLPGTAPEGETETDWQTYIQGIFVLAIGIAGVLAVIMITVGGIQYMTTDAISGKEEGKDTITKAVLGLILALASVLILVTINPNILNMGLNPEAPSSWFILTYTEKPEWSGGYGSPETFIEVNQGGASEEDCLDIKSSMDDPPTGISYECEEHITPPSVSNQFHTTSFHWPSAPTGYSNVYCSTSSDDCENVIISGLDHGCNPEPQSCQSFYGGGLYCTTYGYCPPPGEDDLPTEGYYAIRINQWTHESHWAPWNPGHCTLPIVNDDASWVPGVTFKLEDYNDHDTQTLAACNTYINEQLPHLEPSDCFHYECIHSNLFSE